METKKRTIDDFPDRDLIEMIFYTVAGIERKIDRIEYFLEALAKDKNITYEEDKNSKGIIDQLEEIITKKERTSSYIRDILSKGE